jgi:hypothetical protein
MIFLDLALSMPFILLRLLYSKYIQIQNIKNINIKVK